MFATLGAIDRDGGKRGGLVADLVQSNVGVVQNGGVLTKVCVA